MIVNPQLFNYRLIIGSLLIILTALGIYSFTNHKSIKSYEEFLKQEKFLIEQELSEMLESYDELSEDYDLMASQLQEAKLETKNALDSLRLLKSDLSIITKFKEQLIILKSKSKVLLNTIDSLNIANQHLMEEKQDALNTIERKSSTINALATKNDLLNKAIDNASILKASNISAQSYKLSGAKKRFTTKARRANAIDVCILLAENPLTDEGDKEIYIQIVSPNGNVVGDKGEVFFDDDSLIYSKKELVSYQNENLEVCSAIIADKDDKPFQKGDYIINVFHKKDKLGSTRVTLK
ncbi:hypothetical protein [Winogradskyella poriferorum]|uniref:hypothetical protein n=1 Tax=Winogradskyella poriferorum TaxID=307627 RepID=UPI003D659A05